MNHFCSTHYYVIITELNFVWFYLCRWGFTFLTWFHLFVSLPRMQCKSWVLWRMKCSPCWSWWQLCWSSATLSSSQSRAATGPMRAASRTKTVNFPDDEALASVSQHSAHSVLNLIKIPVGHLRTSSAFCSLPLFCSHWASCDLHEFRAFLFRQIQVFHITA